SLFTKRTEVNSSNDRYSNLEINYLLQRIESFDGVTILTTNFPDNIDDAFARRIKFKVNFPFPEAPDRARLWELMVPKTASRAESIDFTRLGKAFELSGGNIKNAVLRAAFQAAESSQPIDTQLLEHAGIVECREMGKLIRVRDGKVVIT
ncbi:MAG: ATP-binding protein, partial [Myxococcota bacterium]